MCAQEMRTATKYLILPLMALALNGCSLDKKQTLAACKYEALQVSPTLTYEHLNRFIGACMSAKGFEYNLNTPLEMCTGQLISYDCWK